MWELFKMLVDIFLLPFYRLPKSALKLQVESIPHTVFDFLCMGIVLAIFGYFHVWIIIIATSSIIGIALIGGISYHIRHREQHAPIIDENVVDNDDDLDEEIKPPVKTYRSKATVIESAMPDDNASPEVWNAWFKAHPNQQIRSNRKTD